MSTLLVQSCSASKNRANCPTPALDVYSGYFFKIIKKSIREGAFRTDVDLRILSAKHGVLDPDEPIEDYDQRMDRERADQLRERVVTTLADLIDQEQYERVVLNMGRPYRRAVEGLDERVSATVVEIDGDGIGQKGRTLKQFIRGDERALAVTS